MILVRPMMQMPALTPFVDGNGPVFAGKIFPFCFITIACGAISGFHSLISSGTTPKMIIARRPRACIGYGAMLMESFVGVMAMVAACALQPGVYFAINSPAGIVGETADAAAKTISSWGFALDPQTMASLAQRVGEHTLLEPHRRRALARRGHGADFQRHDRRRTPAGASGITSRSCSRRSSFSPCSTPARAWAASWCRKCCGHVWKPLGRTGWTPGILISSALMVGAWGYFLYQGVMDPLGGINSLWPMFGIANQLLACVALVVATTILLKMGRLKWIWVTVLPMAWVVTVTMTASWQKIFDAHPRIGFLSQARLLQDQIASGTVPLAQVAVTHRLIFNYWLNAGVTGVLAVMVLLLLFDAMGQWIAIIRGSKPSELHESTFVATRYAECD